MNEGYAQAEIEFDDKSLKTLKISLQFLKDEELGHGPADESDPELKDLNDKFEKIFQKIDQDFKLNVEKLKKDTQEKIEEAKKKYKACREEIEAKKKN